MDSLDPERFFLSLGSHGGSIVCHLELYEALDRAIGGPVGLSGSLAEPLDQERYVSPARRSNSLPLRLWCSLPSRIQSQSEIHRLGPTGSDLSPFFVFSQV